MRWPTPRRLSTRIVALSLGLLLLVQGAGFLAIHASIERNARDALASELVVGERIWARLLDEKAQSLLQGATLLAADYGFRSAVASSDVDTLSSALENHGARIGARMSAWVDNNANVRAYHGDSAQDEPLLRRVSAELVASPRNTAVVMFGGRPYQFVAVPMRAPVVIGWVVMGFPIDQSMVNDMRALSGLQVAIVAATAAGPAVIVSTLPRSAFAELAAAPAGSAILSGETMVTRRVALGADEKAAGVLLLRSVDEAVARYAQLQILLAAITLLGVGIFAAGSYFTATRVTTPLRSLVRAADRLGRGEYGVPM